MEGNFQRPQDSHAKTISVVLSSSIDSEDNDYGQSARRPRQVEYGKGRSIGVELVPQPSDSPLDPLVLPFYCSPNSCHEDDANGKQNWPQWRKHLTFGSLMLTTAVVGILKSMLVTVNGVIATEFNVSYVAATALTGLPMIVAALTGLGSGVLAKIIGKRAIYLLGGVLMLLSVIWNMHVMESFAQFMASRIFQAVGWGATEALVLESIRDIYFVGLFNAQISQSC